MRGRNPGVDSSFLDDRGVSDVLAFILVFSIIITSVGMVYVFGMDALGDAQVGEQNRNAERGFATLTVSFNDIQTGRGEERLSQLNPRGGQISVDEGTELTVEVERSDGTTRTAIDGQTVGALNYDHEDTTISYELGGAFRADRGHSVMVRPPRFVCSSSTSGGPDRAVLSYANLTATQPSSVSTSSTLRIRAVKEDDTVHQPVDRVGDGPDNRSVRSLTVRIDESEHADAWERYFEDEGWTIDTSPSGTTGTVEATCDADVAYVRETKIEIELL